MSTYDTGTAGGGRNGPWYQQQYQPRLGKVSLVYVASISSHSNADKNFRCRQRSVSGGSSWGVGLEYPSATIAARAAIVVGILILKWFKMISSMLESVTEVIDAFYTQDFRRGQAMK